MIPFNLYEIAPILKARHIGADYVIRTISIHSDDIDKKCMFIALLGKNFDGHDFAIQAVHAGAKALLVNRYLSLDIPQLIVIDTRHALLKLANWVRRQTAVKVIAITGSSGKTSVKEMTASILKGCGRIVATKNNFNNIIGVSITLLRLTKKDDFVIIELGVSAIGEMDELIADIVIDVALVNNIFPSHILGFGSLAVIRKEKGKIYSGLSLLSGIGVVNIDNHACCFWSHALQGKSVLKFSVYGKIGADFFASDIMFNEKGTQFTLHTPYGITSIFLSMLLGYHNVSNALAASALAFSVGATLLQIAFGLENTKILSGRLMPIILRTGKLLLDDTYNSNIGSMVSAIRVLHELPGYKVLVTSDMLELGEYKSVKYHCYIGRYIKTTNIDQVLTVGSSSYFILQHCEKLGRHFCNKIELVTYLQKFSFNHELINILIKGSRNFEMEEIVHVIKDRMICCFG